MLIATGVVALSRKIKDDQAKKKEQKQGLLNVGDSDVAKRAFQSQTTKMLEPGSASSIERRGTEIKFEDPNDIGAASPATTSTPTINSPDATSPNICSPRPDIQDVRQQSQMSMTSPVQSEKGYLAPNSPYSETPTSPMGVNRSTSSSSGPPPYSARSSQAANSTLTPPSPSVYSRDADNQSIATFSDTKSMASWSTNSQGTHSLRIKTKGADLKSGFPYHPGLFDLHVHPDRWENFTYQITEATKISVGESAQVWAAATATALTGHIAASIWLGRSMNRTAQEKKVKAGLADESAGALGDTLKQWNEDYFTKRGLFVHLELSESAMKYASQSSKMTRKPALFYSDPEERARKREERKFVIVVTKLDDEGEPTEAVQELARKEGDNNNMPAEIGSSDQGFPNIAEMPGEDGVVPVELSGDSGPGAAEKKLEPPMGYVEMAGDTFYGGKQEKMGTPVGYVEMSSDNAHLMEKIHLEESGDNRPAVPEKDSLTPRPLMVSPGSDRGASQYPTP